MILVDTSVWVDHLHSRQPLLVEFLERDEVGTHPLVVEELALGRVADRAALLGSLQALHGFPVLTHIEVLALVEGHSLWGRGLSAVDVHLLGSVLIETGAWLWTRDRRLRSAARELGARVVEA